MKNNQMVVIMLRKREVKDGLNSQKRPGMLLLCTYIDYVFCHAFDTAGSFFIFISLKTILYCANRKIHVLLCKSG